MYCLDFCKFGLIDALIILDGGDVLPGLYGKLDDSESHNERHLTRDG